MKSGYRIEWCELVKPSDYLVVPFVQSAAWHVYELLNKNGLYELTYKGQYVLIDERLSQANKLLVMRAVRNERYEKKFPLMRRAAI